MPDTDSRLDALVAEHVFGWERLYPGHSFEWRHDGVYYFKPPHYSTDWLTAITLLETFESYELHKDPDEPYFCRVYVWHDPNSAGAQPYEGEADTGPMAIVLAALRAKGVSVNG